MPRPIMLGIVGDSGSGKTTITRGLVRVLGDDQVTHFCTDDYHRYDRKQRAERNITPLHPDCNHLDILAQHLRHLRNGEAIMKPRLLAHRRHLRGARLLRAGPLRGHRGAARVLHAGAARHVRRARLPRPAGGAAPPLEGAARLLAARLHDRPGALRARPPRARLGGVHPAAAPPRRHRRLVPAGRRARTRSTSTASSRCATRCRTPTSPASSATATTTGSCSPSKPGCQELYVPGQIDPERARAARGGDLGRACTSRATCAASGSASSRSAPSSTAPTRSASSSC